MKYQKWQRRNWKKKKKNWEKKPTNIYYQHWNTECRAKVQIKGSVTQKANAFSSHIYNIDIYILSPSDWTITKYSILLPPVFSGNKTHPLPLNPTPERTKKSGMIEKTRMYKHNNTPALNKTGPHQQYVLAVLSHTVTSPPPPPQIVISLAGTCPAEFRKLKVLHTSQRAHSRPDANWLWSSHHFCLFSLLASLRSS